jgi:hypothetical protein
MGSTCLWEHDGGADNNSIEVMLTSFQKPAFLLSLPASHGARPANSASRRGM